MFRIIGIREDGLVVRLFTWTRGREEGLALARREADEFGEQYRYIRAIPV